MIKCGASAERARDTEKIVAHAVLQPWSSQIIVRGQPARLNGEVFAGTPCPPRGLGGVSRVWRFDRMATVCDPTRLPGASRLEHAVPGRRPQGTAVEGLRGTDRRHLPGVKPRMRGAEGAGDLIVLIAVKAASVAERTGAEWVSH